MRHAVAGKVVATLSIGLLASFLVLESTRVGTSQSCLILWTGAVFAALTVARRTPRDTPALTGDVQLAWMAGGGTLLALSGIVTGFHQFQWLGVLLLVFAGLRWSLPTPYAVNVAQALFVLYWAHPLPGNVFGALRIGMQRLSVLGAEWSLHAFGIPVWADGLVLQTGFRAFEVPEACSGMTTAMIVVVCALGSGALMRLSLARQLILMAAGFAQVLAMNAVRIALMIGLARNAPPGWPDRFLHTSTSALLLLMIVLIQAESALWRWAGQRLDTPGTRRAGRPRSGTRNPMLGTLQRWIGHQREALKHRGPSGGLATGMLDRLLRVRLRYIGAGLLAVLLTLAAVPTFYLLKHRRPAHRATMIVRVADELAQHDLDRAKQAAQAAVAAAPANLEANTTLARIELMRGEHEDALNLLRTLPPDTQDNVVVQLTAWALLGSGKLEEAEALLNHLPPALAIHPGIAMCAAELALRQNDADRAASSAVIAASWPTLTERVRRLYPFLSQHGKWEAIVRSNDPSPYRNADQFRIALVATMAEAATAQTTQLLDGNTALWFGKPTFLPHLQELALRHSDPAWLRRYAASLDDCLTRLSPDELTAVFEPCFTLGRPDLAWRAYLRLVQLDPTHPAATLIPARFAASWYAFRDDLFGGSSAGPSVLNLRAFLRLAARWQPFQRFVDSVPHGRMMLSGPGAGQTAGWVQGGLDELARRQARGDLAYEGFALYERSLHWAGKSNETLTVLDDMEQRFPERRVEILALRGRYYRSRDDWQSLYEVLRQVRVLRPHLDRDMQLMLAETLAQIEMGVCALDVTENVLKRRSDDRPARLLLASLWERFGFTEESLFVLKPLPNLPPSQSLALLLSRTGRYDEALLMDNRIGRARASAYRPRALPRLPPAESVLTWGTGGQTAAPFTTALLDRQLRADVSPFLRSLHQMTRDWLALPAKDRRPELAAWKAAGRDTIEQVSALHRLAFLCAQDGNLPAARLALDEALQLLPSARLLWRMRIAVAGTEAATVVAAARRACPADSEIWLAALVLNLRQHHTESAAIALRDASAQDSYSPATLIRAGYALLKAGDSATAALAAKAVMAKSRHYLPACLLGLDAALASRHDDDAVTCALLIADSAPDPAPFLEIAVRFGMRRENKSPVLTRALETLVSLQPDSPEWALRLGTLQYENSLFQLARDAFGRWLVAPPAAADPNLLVMMADTARRCEDQRTSVALLREAHRRFPTNASVINGLAWTLAQTPATLPEAQALLPSLTGGGTNASVLDTLATIHLRSGNLDTAQRLIAEALARLKPGDSHWMEIHMNAAEIACGKGQSTEAERLLYAAYDRRQLNKALLDPRFVMLERRINALKRGLPP